MSFLLLLNDDDPSDDPGTPGNMLYEDGAYMLYEDDSKMIYEE